MVSLLFNRFVAFLGNFTKRIYNIFHNSILSNVIWSIVILFFLYSSSQYFVKDFFFNLIISIPIIVSLALMTNRITFSLLITLLIGAIIHFATLFKVNIFNDTLNYDDIILIVNFHKFAAWELLESYITKNFLMYLFVIILIIAYVYYYSEKLLNNHSKNYFKKRFIMIVAGISILISLYNLISTPKIFFNALVMIKLRKEEYCLNVFSKNNKQQAICNYIGPFSDIAYSINTKNLSPKPVYSDSSFIIEKIKDFKIEKDNEVKNKLPNVILVLNESTFNPKYLDYNFSKNLRYRFFEENNFTKFSGILKVHTIGGGSSKSEYPSVTGIVHSVFTSPASYPFSNLTKHTNVSLFKELKKQGYYTILVYPVDRKFFNAENAYTELGVDKIIDINDYNFIPEKWRDVPDRLLTKMVADQIKKAPKNKPVFVYLATMINHGPHSEKSNDLIGCNLDLEEKLCSKVNDYINRLDKTDKDFTKFSNNILSSEKPTMIINFGDHLPSFEGAITNMRFNYGKNEEVDYYRTFYTIKSNFEITEDLNYDYLDISYIPGVILDVLKIEDRSDFYKANSFMRKKCKGKLFDCELDFQNYLESYKAFMQEQLGFKPEVVSKDIESSF